MPVQTQIQVRRGTASSWTSTNPTLAAGEIGFETDTGKIKVGNGSSTWSALNYVGAANAIQYVYNATAGQTSFSGADSNGLTLSYTVGAEQVYVNGVLQVRTSDYTATNGTSVTLTTATIASDVVTIVAFGTFDIANTYTQAQANATFPLNTSSFFAGKNKIINGDFGIWQRGTSFSANGGFMTADRFRCEAPASGTASTVTQQTFAYGDIAGYNPTYYLRMAKNNTVAGGLVLNQRIEDVRTFAGQVVTVSFWAKGNVAFTNEPLTLQSFGSGGSADVYTTYTTQNITTSWARYSMTFTVPSVSGKTIGAGSFLGMYAIRYTGTADITIDTWGWQLEAGSTATAFQTATGTIQGELAACQRYYYRHASGLDTAIMSAGAYDSTVVGGVVKFATAMRTAPTLTVPNTAGYFKFYRNGGNVSAATLSLQEATTNSATIFGTFGASTAGHSGWVTCTNASSYIDFGAEL